MYLLPKVHFKKFIKKNNLVDIWRKHNPDFFFYMETSFTWDILEAGLLVGCC